MSSMDLSGFEVPVLAHLGLSIMGGPGGLARRVAEPTIPAWGGRCTSEVAPAHRSVSGDLPRHGHAERAHWRTHSAEHESDSRSTFALCTLMSRGVRRALGGGAGLWSLLAWTGGGVWGGAEARARMAGGRKAGAGPPTPRARDSAG